MNGNGYGLSMKASINNDMIYFWSFIAFVCAVAIYWIMDWKSQHEDGE